MWEEVGLTLLQSGLFHGRVGGRERPVTDRWCLICFSLFTQNRAGHAVEHHVPSCNDSSNDSNMEPMSAGYDSYTFTNFKVNSGSAQLNAAVLIAQQRKSQRLHAGPRWEWALLGPQQIPSQVCTLIISLCRWQILGMSRSFLFLVQLKLSGWRHQQHKGL